MKSADYFRSNPAHRQTAREGQRQRRGIHMRGGGSDGPATS